MTYPEDPSLFIGGEVVNCRCVTVSLGEEYPMASGVDLTVKVEVGPLGEYMKLVEESLDKIEERLPKQYLAPKPARISAPTGRRKVEFE